MIAIRDMNKWNWRAEVHVVQGDHVEVDILDDADGVRGIQLSSAQARMLAKAIVDAAEVADRLLLDATAKRGRESMQEEEIAASENSF